MKKQFTLIIFALFTFITTNVFASAVIVDMTGSVKAKLPGKSEALATSGMELPDGTVVNVGGGAEASLLLDSGALDQLSSGSTYTVGKTSAGEKRTNLGSGIALAMRELSNEGEGPTVHGMVRETGTVVADRDKFKKSKKSNPNMVDAIFPRGTGVVVGSKITFKWENTPAVNWNAPVLIIDDASKKHIAVLPIAKDSTSLSTTVANAKIVRGAKYSWYLGTKSPGVKGMTKRFEFWTLTTSKEGSLKGDLAKIRGLNMSNNGKGLLIAQTYYANGLYDDMVRELAPVYSKNKAPFIKKLLRDGYAKMGQSKRAPK